MGLSLTLDGVNIKEYNICIAERPKRPVPNRETEEEHVEGRHGSLFIDKEYESMDLTVNFNILEDHNLKPDFRRIVELFTDKKILQFSDDTLVYHISRINFDDIENEFEVYGSWDVNFTVEPFQYLPDNWIEIENDVGMYNDGQIESEPAIRIIGTGDCTLNVDGHQIKISGIEQEPYVIDSDLMNAFEGPNEEDANYKMVGEFPVIQPGHFKINWTGSSIKRVELNGRWRYL